MTLVLDLTSSGVDFKAPAGSGIFAVEGVGDTGGFGAMATGAIGGFGWAITGATGAAGAAGITGLGATGACGTAATGATGGLGSGAAMGAGAGAGAGAGIGGLGKTGAVGGIAGAGVPPMEGVGNTGAVGRGGWGMGGAGGFGRVAVGASPKPLIVVGIFGEVGAGGMEDCWGSEPRGRVTDSMLLAETGDVPSILEVGGLIAEGAIMGAAALPGAGRGGITLPKDAPGFGGREMRMVSFLIFPCVILSEGLGIGTVCGVWTRLFGCTFSAGAGAAGAAGRGTPCAAADKPVLMAIVCLGNDMPTGISGFWVMRLGGATGSLAPTGKLGLGGGGGGTAILC